MRPDTPRASIKRLLVALAILTPLAACSNAERRAEPTRPPRTTVSASDFANDAVARTPTQLPAPQTISQAEASEGAENVRVSIAQPTNQRPALAQPPDEEQRFLVDEMVGQVNGKPIYANEFFADMDARLRAESRRMPLQEWVNMVSGNVAGKLRGETQDELLLSEFQSSLTPEQRVGVLAFIEDLRKDIQRGYGGSSELANQRLQEEEGVTLREKVESEAERQFILAQLRETIAKRVQVSYKDIELFYNQNIDKYQPTPDAVFRVIRVPTKKTTSLAKVTQALADGQSPIEIAAEFSNWATDDANIHRVTLETGSLAETQVWGPEILDEPSRQLEPGQTTPRIDVGSSAWWIYLEQFDQPEGRSLYDVQLEIEGEIRRQRIQQEEARYWEGLVQRSNMTQFDEMVKRLVAYAAERYYVQRIQSGEDVGPVAIPAESPSETQEPQPQSPNEPEG